MIDKTEIECRFRRSVDSYEDNATVQKWIVQRLVELLQEYVPYSSRTLEIGCAPTCSATDMMAKSTP